MGTRTQVTTWIDVPITVGWKCSKCGKQSISSGVIHCESFASSAAWTSKKRYQEASTQSKQILEETWKDFALDLITDPVGNPQNIRKGLRVDNNLCTQCQNKEKWNADMQYLRVFAISFIVALIFGLIVLGKPTVFNCIMFGLSLAGIAWSIFTEKHFPVVLKQIPRESLPLITTSNNELIKYAESKGIVIDPFSPIIKFLTAQNSSLNNNNTALYEKEQSQMVDVSTEKDLSLSACSEGNKKNYKFCRKCGTQLAIDSNYCNHCGTKVV